MIRVVAGQAHPAVSRARGIAWMCDAIQALLPRACAAGITLAYESHTKATALVACARLGLRAKYTIVP